MGRVCFCCLSVVVVVAIFSFDRLLALGFCCSLSLYISISFFVSLCLSLSLALHLALANPFNSWVLFEFLDFPENR